MEACAICAVKDWIENRFQMYLFAQPDSIAIDSGQEEEEKTVQRYFKNGLRCIGNPERVDELLGVQHYIASWPKIPVEELHASSVQHPRHPHMRWLLHSRRVPTSPPTEQDGAQSPVGDPRNADTCGNIPKCAGVGLEDSTVWTCPKCSSCLCRKRPLMPDLALANWMWLGRVHSSYRDLSLGMRLLLGLGRPVMRVLYLGKGQRDEVHRGLQGNSMIVAQPSATYSQVTPNVANAMSSLVIIFCNSVDDVTRAHTLIVNREQYKTGMQRRIQVCPVFENVSLDDETLIRDIPNNDIPQAFLNHAVAMPEISKMITTMDGPASRHSQFGNPPADSSSEEGDEDQHTEDHAHANDEAAAVTTEPSNDFETVIGVDTTSNESEIHLFETMQREAGIAES